MKIRIYLLKLNIVMKKIFPILLISAFLLSSCSIDWNDEKDKKISELEKQINQLSEKSKNDVFQKRNFCSNQYDSLKKNLLWWKKLMEVFYSPVKDSCLYIYQVDEQNGDFYRYQLSLWQDPENAVWWEFCVFFAKTFDMSNCNRFDEKIEKLK